jgi:ectoine hydroxylase-related dioxygenase (phytanoyl-CoA dioxygenase family)
MRDAGFEIVQGILRQSECDALLGELSRRSDSRQRAGSRHLMADPVIARLAVDGRISAIARSILGKSAIPFRATLFDKSQTANWLVPWHQDTALPLATRFEHSAWGPWSRKAGILYAHAPASALSRVVALRIHLDDSTRENGPLRVMPGSHEGGVLSDEEVREYVRTRDPIACPVSRGGVLAMRPLLIHASSKSRIDRPRRVLHIEYADALELTPDIRLAIA